MTSPKKITGAHAGRATPVANADALGPRPRHPPLSFDETMKRDFSIESSELYDISPHRLRDLDLELCKRSRDNAYRSHPDTKDLSDEQRGQRYDDLKERIRREGFKKEFPIVVMLLRKDGKKDKILQGHHRLSMAIELGLSTVPVRFVC